MLTWPELVIAHIPWPHNPSDTGLGPKLSLGLGSSHSLHPIRQKAQDHPPPPPPPRLWVPAFRADSRVVLPLFSESPSPSGTILLLRLNPSTGGALTTKTQPEEPETAACRSSGITTSLSCQVRFRSSGSCSIGPLRRVRRLGSTLANQDAGWLSGGGGRGASLPAVSLPLLRGERGSFVVASASFVASRLGVASCCFCRVGRGCLGCRAGECGCFKAVLEKEAVTSGSRRSLRVPRRLRAEWKGLAAESEPLHSKCCPYVGT